MVTPVRLSPSGPVIPGALEDHLVSVTAADAVPNFLGPKLVGAGGITLAVLNPGGNEQVEITAPPPPASLPPSGPAGGGLTGTYPNPGVNVAALYPVHDTVFSIDGAGDPSKAFKVSLNDMPGGGNILELRPGNTVSRPFRTPDISGTAVVQQDTTGQVLMGIGVTGTLNGSNAGVQYSSTTANRGAYRANQYGANTGVPGLTGFKSRGASIGVNAGCIAGDVLARLTAIGVCPDNASIPLAGYCSFVVPTAFVPAGQPYLPVDFEVETTPLTGPTNNHRRVLRATSEGEAQTLAGVRAGGKDTTAATIADGSLWSSGLGAPNGVVTGSVGDLYTQRDGGAGTTLWVKESGTATNTGWVGK